MELRRDAFQGLAHFASRIGELLEAVGTPSSRLTVGKVDLVPNFSHTVPGAAKFIVNGRDLDESIMRALRDGCKSLLQEAADLHDLELRIEEKSWLPPSPCHADVIAAFERQARHQGLDVLRMPSGAGHDTQMMARITRAGMIFVPSAKGIR
jgi:N-carbamoyl-L-amino-acid hydrolase